MTKTQTAIQNLRDAVNEATAEMIALVRDCKEAVEQRDALRRAYHAQEEFLECQKIMKANESWGTCDYAGERLEMAVDALTPDIVGKAADYATS